MTQETNKNTAQAIGKSLKTSPQKANLVLSLIRGKKAEEALNLLTFSRKRISEQVSKILKSAISNAENNHQLDIDKLYVKEFQPTSCLPNFYISMVSDSWFSRSNRFFLRCYYFNAIYTTIGGN